MANPPPSKKAKIGSFQRFLPRYTSTWPFIVKSKLGDNLACCTLCKKDFKISTSGEFDIKRHISGVKHKDLQSSTKLPSVASMFGNVQSSAEKREQDIQDKAQEAELTLINLIADLNLPISSADKFSKAFKDMFPDSEIAKRFSCARTKTTAIAKDMAKLHQTKLFKRMRNGPFTLSTDGSNDEKYKLFPLVVRSINPITLAVDSELLALPVCDGSATGENIFKLLDAIMAANNIPWAHCISLGCDNASVMTGIHKGVFAFVKEKNPNVFLAGCTLHLVHLAAEKASDLLPFSPADLLTDIYYYFQKSSVRQSNLASFQALHGKEQKKLLKHVATRWLSIGKCLNRLLDNWGPLKSFFMSEKEDRKKATSNYASSKVKLVSDKLSSNTAKLYTFFLKYATTIFEKFLTINQSNAPRIAKLRSSMLELLKDVLKQFVKPSAFAGNNLALEVDFISSYNIKLNEDILIGQETRDFLHQKKSSFSDEKEKEFYGNVIVYFQKVVSYLKANLPFKNSILMDLSITDPDCVACDSNIRKVKSFAITYPVLLHGHTMDELLSAFADLQILSVHKAESGRDDHTWGQVAQQEPSVRPACLFLLGLLTIPHGSAHCERVFSCVRKNRTDFRPNLGVDTLEGLMILKHMSGGPLSQIFTKEEKKFLKCSASKAVKADSA